MACSDSERAAYQKKLDYRKELVKKIRPNRNQGRFSPPPVHLPRRGKMKARAA